jgi:hypothetical protein
MDTDVYPERDNTSLLSIWTNTHDVMLHDIAKKFEMYLQMWKESEAGKEFIKVLQKQKYLPLDPIDIEPANV